MLAVRLPAYRGVLRAHLQAAAREQQENGGGNARPAGRGRPGGYERSSGMANNARTADTAPPATGASLTALNAQLGASWFKHRVVKPGD